MRQVRTQIPHEELRKLGADEIVDFVRDNDVDNLVCLSCSGSRGFGVVRTETDIDERVFAGFESINHQGSLQNGQGRVEHFVEIALDDGLVELVDEFVVDMFVDEPITVTDHGLEFTVVVAQQTIPEIQEEIREYLGGPIECRVLSVGEYTGREKALDHLTERQREILQTAYDAGYYEVPRQVTTEEIARQLDLDRSTVNEHLQRAELNVFSHLLGDRDRPRGSCCR